MSTAESLDAARTRFQALLAERDLAELRDAIAKLERQADQRAHPIRHAIACAGCFLGAILGGGAAGVSAVAVPIVVLISVLKALHYWR
jgi:hypothetical protein